MLINGTEISLYQAKQHTVTIEHSGIRNESDWQPYAAVPFLDRNQTGFKEWTVVLIVKGAGREEIIQNCSDILSLLIEPADLTLDGFDHHFRGILKSHDRKETVPRRYHKLELTFEGYEYGEEIITTANSAVSFTVTNPGNMVSPCIVEITPQIGVASLTITGICRDSYTGEDLPVTIDNLETGKAVILNGLTGLITQAGEQKGGDVLMWALPSMLPGENVIMVSSERMNITIKSTPFYL